METVPEEMSTRVLDLLVPLGKGQRGLIVSPPRTGKTVLLQKIANAITKNHPEVYLIVLLIDERPEEVTDMQRSVKGEVVSSTLDEPPEAPWCRWRRSSSRRPNGSPNTRRMSSSCWTSITPLGRAYNTIVPALGKVLSRRAVDSNALQRPKRFFATAVISRRAGSLTIIARRPATRPEPHG
jgi:transcription termination factor Rho